MKKGLLAFAAGILLTASTVNAAKVYFENTNNWTGVYSYAWTPNDIEPFTRATEKIINDDKNVPHTLYLRDTGDKENVIFLNANNWKDRTLQTADLVATDGAVYNGNSLYVADIIDGVYGVSRKTRLKC